jgi:exodeoxyribonuclease-5
MSWSPQQEGAIKSVKAWLADKNGPQIFRLFGYAGTGKTTLAKELASSVTGIVLYACFTGKAALVLRKKGCFGASTIHSLIYKAVQDEATGEYQFRLNDDSPAALAALIIIDEVSMIGSDIGNDLLSFGRKVLVLGDPAQLPPISGEGFFINSTPDVMLTEVHRQAADNPIIRLSMDVREGRPLRLGMYGESMVVSRTSIDRDELQSIVLESDQVLCGLNKTRQTYNARIRDLKGLRGDGCKWHPAATDRLVCLRNDHEKGILNGGLWEVESTNCPGRAIHMRVRSLDEPEKSPVDVRVLAPFFNGGEKDIDWKEKKGFEEFTYGYCLTTHKSQGSQWDNILVFDESQCFRETAANWLYTAITRAAERVTIVQ